MDNGKRERPISQSPPLTQSRYSPQSPVFNPKLQKNTKYYLIESHWYETFLAACKDSKVHVCQIDNSKLLDKLSLKSGLIWKIHFQVLSHKDWLKLVDQYSIVNNTHEISRYAIVKTASDSSSDEETIELEIKLNKIKIISTVTPDLQTNPITENGYNIFTLDYSKLDTVGEITERIERHLHFQPGKITVSKKSDWFVHLDKSAKLETLFSVEDCDPALVVKEASNETEFRSNMTSSSGTYTNGNPPPFQLSTGLSSIPSQAHLQKQLLISNQLKNLNQIQTELPKEVDNEESSVYSPIEDDDLPLYGADSAPPSNSHAIIIPLPPPFTPTPTAFIPTTISNNFNSYRSTSHSSTFRNTMTTGATGLNNLGNTCFMNSALQCLSNAAPLTAYFLEDLWKNELNTDNPMGMNGSVAEKYANLLYEIWQTSEMRPSSVAPRDFKYTIGKFNSTFSGYYQQDSQELLGSLLDGLHEDLNRILKKPYTTIPEMEGEKDEKIANKIWELYKLRNDSIIVDLFQGEYRSRVECRVCGRKTVTFDPYMFLTLPIPQEKDIEFICHVMPKPDNPNSPQSSFKPFKFALRIQKDASIFDLRTQVGEVLGWKKPKAAPSTVSSANYTFSGTQALESAVVEVFSHRVYKVFTDSDLVSEISKNDEIYVVELGSSCSGNFSQNSEKDSIINENSPQPPLVELAHIPCYFLTRSTGQYLTSEFGIPAFVSIPKKIIFESTKENGIQFGKRLYREVVNSISRYSKIPLFQKVKSFGEPIETIDNAAEENPFVFGDPGVGYEPIPDLFILRIVREKKSQTSSTYYKSTSHDFFNKTYKDTYNSNIKVTRVYPAEVDDKPDTVMEDVNETLLKLPNFAPPPQPPIDDYDSLMKDNAYSTTGSEMIGNGILRVDIIPPKDEALRDFTKSPLSPVSMDDGMPHLDEAGADYMFDVDVNDRMVISRPEKEGGVFDAKGSNVVTEKTEEKKGDQFFFETGDTLFLMEWNPDVVLKVFGDNLKDTFSSVENERFLEFQRSEQEKKDNQKTKKLTLKSCLEEFTKEETLGETDTFYCSRCKEHQTIKKKIDIWSVPEILVFSLKRFSNSQRSSFRYVGGKIDSLVDFPLKGLTLGDTIIGKGFEERKMQNQSDQSMSDDCEPGDNLVYDLFGVSNHMGGTGGGHYTAYAKNPIDEEWYLFDDSSVRKVDVDRVVSKDGYMLFYQKRSLSKNNSRLADVIERRKKENIISNSNMASSSSSITKYGPSNPTVLGASDMPLVLSLHGDRTATADNVSDSDWPLVPGGDSKMGIDRSSSDSTLEDVGEAVAVRND